MCYQFDTETNDDLLKEIAKRIGDDCFFAIRFINKAYFYSPDENCFQKFKEVLKSKALSFAEITNEEMIQIIENMGLTKNGSLVGDEKTYFGFTVN